MFKTMAFHEKMVKWSMVESMRWKLLPILRRYSQFLESFDDFSATGTLYHIE